MKTNRFARSSNNLGLRTLKKKLFQHRGLPITCRSKFAQGAGRGRTLDIAGRRRPRYVVRSVPRISFQNIRCITRCSVLQSDPFRFQPLFFFWIIRAILKNLIRSDLSLEKAIRSSHYAPLISKMPSAHAADSFCEGFGPWVAPKWIRNGPRRIKIGPR